MGLIIPLGVVGAQIYIFRRGILSVSQLCIVKNSIGLISAVGAGSLEVDNVLFFVDAVKDSILIG